MSTITRCRRLRLPHQFFEVCDEHLKKSLEPLTPWKLDRMWYESGQAHYDESTGLPLDPKMVADAVTEEFAFMRWLQVYHKVPGVAVTNLG